MDAPTRFKSGGSRPPAAPTDDGDDWDAVIARAKMRAERQITPRPVPQVPRRAGAPERAKATLNALMQGGWNKQAALRQAFAARRPPAEETVTPPPLAKPGRAPGPPFGPTKRP